jgi:hypothetical protein
MFEWVVVVGLAVYFCALSYYGCQLNFVVIELAKLFDASENKSVLNSCVIIKI